MENQDERDGTIRHPQPDAAARDPRPAAVQDQTHPDSEANRHAAERRASTPNEVSEETVAEIAADAEARARR